MNLHRVDILSVLRNELRGSLGWCFFLPVSSVKAKVVNYQNSNRIHEIELKIHFSKILTPFDKE